MSLLALAAAVALAAPARPNIVLITIDTLRADHLGSYGAARVETPQLDRLAREGLRFDSAVSPVPLTRPAHASLLTGLYPHQHGVRDNLPGALDSSIPTLSQLLREAGYQTGGFVGTFLLGRGSGLEHGFQSFSDGAAAADRIGAGAERRASVVAAEAVAFLETAKPPFFLWVHFYDPHAPYEPPEPYAKTYAGEVAYVDSEVGTLLRSLDSLGLSDSTWVLATADHGEGLGEHGEEEHGVLVYESTLRVPLILRRPNAKPGVENEPVSLVDVFPTLLAAAGLTAETSRGLLSPMRRPLYFESYYGSLHFGWAPVRGVREGDLKLIFAPRSELFDLSDDPNEARNLAQDRKSAARDLYRKLLEIEKDARAAAAPESLSPGDAERLASLGYLGRSAGAATGADPKDEIEKFSGFGRLLREATRRFHGGDFRGALPLFEDLARRDILSFEVHLYLARCHRLSGDVPSALREYEAAAVIYDDYSLLHFEWGQALLHAEKLDDAAARFEKSFSIAPSARAAVGLATASRKLGETGRAIEALRKAIGLDGNDADSWNELGALLLARDEVTEAIEAFEKAVALRPDDELFRVNLDFARERARP